MSATTGPGGAVEPQGASAEAIQHHYDLGNDFFELWLDSTLSYTCAMWEENDGLESAQARKTDYMIFGARAQGAERVLDVGCGWGGTMRRMVDAHGVGHVTGITLSRAQEEYIAAQDDDRIDVRLEDWRDHISDTPYDAIIALGVMEHAVRRGLSRADRVTAYRHFFTKCHELLSPGGWMTVQTIAKGNVPLDEEAFADAAFLLSEIFPETDPPRLSELAHGAEKLFEIVTIRNDRPHYVRTSLEWHRRLLAAREQAEAIVGPEVFESYDRYLPAGARQFERGQLNLLRLTLRSVPYS